MAYKRWSTSKRQNVRTQKIDEFIDEVIIVCKKHGFSISHEDSHGAFIVEVFNPEAEKWLRSAHDGTGE